MHGITNPAVEEYFSSLLPAREGVLAEMEERARQQQIPIVGPAVGRYLELTARMIGARRVFEFGSAIGYSTLWWAMAVGPGGKVYYTEMNTDRATVADSYLKRAGLRDRVEFLVGDALELFDGIDGDFDIIFNDLDKRFYPAVLEKAAPRVRSGGLLVTDNVLWYGRVADASVQDRDTQAIREFNRNINADRRFFTSIIPLRDGLSVSLRIPETV